MKIYWKPEKPPSAISPAGDRYYGWAFVGFSEKEASMACVRIGFLIDGLLEGWNKISSESEYTHVAECMLYLVVRRLPDERIGVGLWQDYSCSKRRLCTEEVVVTSKEFGEMVVRFIREISKHYIQDESTSVWLESEIQKRLEVKSG